MDYVSVSLLPVYLAGILAVMALMHEGVLRKCGVKI